jgi:hypothetical protein
MKFCTHFFIALLLLSSTVKAETEKTSKLSLLEFRGGGLLILQGSTYTLTGELSWNPKYRLTNDLGLIANIGIAFPAGTGGALFILAEYELLARYTLKTLFFELGLGAQTWFTSPSNTTFLISANAGYIFDHKVLSVIQSVFVGYSLHFMSTLSHQIKAGVAVSF